MIDVILTTMTSYYKQVTICDPIKPDTDDGKPSDHKVIIINLRDGQNQIRKSEYRIKIARPMPESKVEAYKIALNEYDFSEILKESDANAVGTKLFDIMMSNREINC